jgi:hypothetical protein
MAKVIKLDLHTHPIEALRDQMGIKGIQGITPEVARLIVAAIKSAGLNGIAITEHANFVHSWVTCLQIMDHFQKENLIVLPGSEIDYDGQQFLELYVPGYVRRRIPFFQNKEWFLILGHPGHYNPLDFQKTGQVSFDAVEQKSLLGEFQIARRISQDRSIPIIQSSDARKLEDIGRLYTEVESR